MFDDMDDWVKYGIAIAAVVIVVIAIFSITSNDNTVKAVQMEGIQQVDSDGDGVDDAVRVGYHAQTNYGDYSGNGKLKIKYSGTTVYTGTIKCSSGAGEKTIPFNEFVMGNGQYAFTVIFGDAQKTQYMDVDWVVETIDLTMQMNGKPTKSDPTVKINLFIRLTSENGSALGALSPGLGIDEITVKGPSGSVVYSADRDTIMGLDTNQLTYSFSVPYDSWEKGVYTASATLRNLMCSDESDYSELTATFSDNFDAPPIAVLEASTTEVTTLQNTVTFDATESRDDGSIVSYTWRVYDASGNEIANSTESAGNAEDGTFDGKWTYSFTGPSGTYRVVLSVLDDGVENFHVSTDEVYVTKTLSPI